LFETYRSYLQRSCSRVPRMEQLVEEYSAAWGGTRHHAYSGGLLVHTAEVLRAADLMCGDLSLELEMAILYHDYGKLREYTQRGEVLPYRAQLGHVFGSAHFVLNAHSLGAVGFRERVASLILSHHGRRDWKSITVPQDADALRLHAADLMSASHGRVTLSEPPSCPLFAEEKFNEAIF
jgi:putative nucleotidyltransferase with HDIG domain